MKMKIDVKQKKTIAVDLDGTLAYYDGWKGADQIGDPIPKMLSQVKKWIKEGHRILIFTARVSDKDTKDIARKAITKWLEYNGLPKDLKITCTKTMDIAEFYDDRAFRVEVNTGNIL